MKLEKQLIDECLGCSLITLKVDGSSLPKAKDMIILSKFRELTEI